MSDASRPLEFTPSDYIGAVKQGLDELHRYLTNCPVAEVNVAVCQAHLERLRGLIGQVVPATQPDADIGSVNGRDEARAH